MNFKLQFFAALFISFAAYSQVPHQYRFQGSYADDWSATPLVPNGGSITNDGYVFGVNQGLTLNDAIGAAYTMDLTYKFTSVNGYWAKIYDLSGLQYDSGFYRETDGTYDAYPNPRISGEPGLNVLSHLTITRMSTKQVSVYSNGQLLGTYANDGGVLDSNINGSNKAIFFIDDRATGQREAGAGVVTYLRVFNTALPPDQVQALKPPCIPNNIPNQDATGSNSVVAQPTAQSQQGLQLYYTYAHASNWWGQATAIALDPQTGNYGATLWDGSCTLTGGLCRATGQAVVALPYGSRTILTWNDASGQGVPFLWSSLSAAQRYSLGSARLRLDYLRGSRFWERPATEEGGFRQRTSVLGDIVNSGPSVVSVPSSPYSRSWSDALYPGASMPENTTPDNAYQGFSKAYANRATVMYTGANDGFLHGFRAGVLNPQTGVTSNLPTRPNDGIEVLAYMPAAVLNTIRSPNSSLYDYSSPQYWHNAYVDAVPGNGDLFYNNAWHTWLVGGLGPGGSVTGPLSDQSINSGSLYALDVTNPDQFQESNAKNLVIGDWNASNIQCVGTPGCGVNLGALYGTPVIVRTHGGVWAAIFGNGFYSQNGSAGIFVMLVDPATGAPSFRYLDTGFTGGENGIAYVTPVDLDGDNITDYVYAGDLQGNVWRFDLTNSDPSKWRVSSPGPLFSAFSNQPISTSLVVVPVPNAGGDPRVMVGFGTGQQQPATQTFQPIYAPGGQAIYGVWDWNMHDWNTRGSRKFAEVTGLPTLDSGKLARQTISGTQVVNGVSYRTIAATAICWPGSSCVGTPNYGWRIRLPASTAGTTEQVIYNPTYQSGQFIVNTSIPVALTQPAVNIQTACTPSGFNAISGGFTMVFSLATGSASATTPFADPAAPSAAVGAMVNGVGTPQIRYINGKYYLYQKNLAEQPIKMELKFPPPASSSVHRVTWVQLR
jgi:type IV pilus assembly protein PilY1